MNRLLKLGAVGLSMISGAASAGIVDDYCKGFPQRYEYCMDRQESDAVLALSGDVRVALFEGINARRKAGLESGKIKRTPVPVCLAVKDFGRLPRASGIWVIKCEDDRMYGVQFDRDVVMSGISCAFLGSMLGAPCAGAVWMMDEDMQVQSEAAAAPED